ncbi:MAG: CaCA family Na(+)/Ca(+) antiporter (YrbG) [Nitrosopumilales archaeon]|nr:MAG: CaCA family Na(+)/Ca(+) antiporter (YrbG) [Nitrosopumilales archaeon]
MLEILFNVFLTLVGITMLCFGGNWLVSGGAGIAKKLRVSQIVIGLTIVAYGTSTPELAAGIAAVDSHHDLLLGNIVGSNISNIGLVIGISAIMIPLMLRKRFTLKRESLVMIGVALYLVAISIDGELSQTDGIISLAGLGVFTYFIYRKAKKERDSVVTQNDKGKQKSFPKYIFFLIIGIVLLYFGAIFAVENAVIVAESFGVSERVIGITVIAIGTSLPELVTSVIAIRKGHTEIGLGNIIGSNIYNILMILGITSVITSITVTPIIFTDYWIMIAFSIVFLGLMKFTPLSKKEGIGLTAAFFAYIAALFFLI